MKIKLYLKIFLTVIPVIYSNISFADYSVSVNTQDNTQIMIPYYNYPYSCPNSNGVHSPVCNYTYMSGSNSDTFSFYDPSGKKRFKFFLTDTGNWALNSYFGDQKNVSNSFIQIPTPPQIQLHGINPVVYIYSNATGVYIRDQDDKVFELVTWN
ncbi:hypothetical protein GCL60_03885 [Silvanigrella paludirubra]|uniref:Secreted protein n=1 Tax=Silvanigrella paludirubra TaxID=2499159 RepID=A0A6N6W0Y6_9BACT|nr:hypothetical protein [Silvanigrella paludirubra]KAB8041088.1 hypothetical protein GCL60_03885 [Silvanigrella paludirubra]